MRASALMRFRSIPEPLVVGNTLRFLGRFRHRAAVKDVLPVAGAGIGEPHAPMRLHIAGIMVSGPALAGESRFVVLNIGHRIPLLRDQS